MAELEVYVPEKGRTYHFLPRSGWVGENHTTASTSEISRIVTELPAQAVVIDGFLLHEGVFYDMFGGKPATITKTKNLYKKLQVALETEFAGNWFNSSEDMILYECILGNGSLKGSKNTTLVNCEGRRILEGAELALVFDRETLNGIYRPEKAILIGRNLGYVDSESEDVVVLASKVRNRLPKKVQVYPVKEGFLKEIESYLEKQEKELLSTTDVEKRKHIARETRIQVIRQCMDFAEIDKKWLAA